MTWNVVARKDVADARRSRSLWALTALFVLFTVLAAVVYTLAPELDGAGGEELSAVGLLGILSAPAALFIAIAAVVIGYRSIAGEAESGSGKLLLGLPHSRRDVVLGKVAGRTVVLAGAVLIGLAVALVVIVPLYASFSPVSYALFAATTVLFALAYVSVVVGLSATTTSTARAATYAVGFFFVFELLWDVVVMAAALVANGFDFGVFAGDPLPAWALFINQLAPSAAYVNAASGMLASNLAGSEVPIYLQSWVGVVVLVVWAIVPVTLGYLRYRRADL